MNSEEILTNTISNGEVEVNVSPAGTFYGSDAEGNAIPENLTEESLQRLADNLNASNEQILVDADHASCRAGIDKDTSACGWLEKFFVKPLKGLWAKLKLTNKGRDLVENRVYRFLSPVFRLDKNGEPIELHSAALTNCPALAPDIAPIINAKPNQETLKMEITRDELVALIKDTVVAMNSAPEVTEEVKEEVKEEVAEAKAEGETVTKEDVAEEVKEETSEAKEEKKDDITEEQAEKLVDEAVANACGDKVEVKNEAEKPEVKEEEKKEEVIKIEALNAAPTALGDVSGKSNWMNLHGDEFWKYLREHPEVK